MPKMNDTEVAQVLGAVMGGMISAGVDEKEVREGLSKLSIITTTDEMWSMFVRACGVGQEHGRDLGTEMLDHLTRVKA